MATGHGIAVHALGTGAPEAAFHVAAQRGPSAGIFVAPGALVHVPALVLRIALVALGALAPVITRQIHAESPSSAGSLVIALVHVDTLEIEIVRVSLLHGSKLIREREEKSALTCSNGSPV